MALSIKPYIENKERIHLIGIGGVSMNSLAELLLSKGVPVSGSDRLRTDVTARLEALGASITYEHRPENVEGASLIVRTAAVHDENPEIVRAHELGIPVMERAEAWGHIMRDYDNVVCLSGTHGKTTSTSMMTMMTIEAQMDPTVAPHRRQGLLCCGELRVHQFLPALRADRFGHPERRGGSSRLLQGHQRHHPLVPRVRRADPDERSCRCQP